MRTRTHRLLAVLCGALLLGVCIVSAQPKPKSQKEVEALQKAVAPGQTPDAQIANIDAVLTNFADTEYKIPLMQMALGLAEQKGDPILLTVWGERLLDADPKNVIALNTLAGQIASGTKEYDLDKQEKLAKAEKYARDAIANAPDVPKPRPDIPDDQWASVKKDFGAQGHQTLGIIAVLNKKYDVAITEFKASLDTAGTQDPATMVRLGDAYAKAGKNDDAAAAYDRAMNTPNANPVVKQAAQQRKALLPKKP
jgi:tetratricopeptide (TPR) repeat protein